MKQHTSGLKQVIKTMGKEIDSIITYGNTTLHDELYSVTPLFEGNILKSVMKQLDVETSVDIPIGTVINYQLGIKVEGNYEYLDYGNYVVTKSEKQEDLGTYKLTCYDKLVYSMKQNENLGVTYPIKIKDYLTALATKIGLTVKSGTFYNQDLYINQELYVGLEYTYRDILDEIAQATGSIICLDEDDKIEVRYPNTTGDTINEEYLKDVNVNFGEKYGKINSIVLSRAGESDNVYLRDEESVLEDGLCEVKIVDNQIMNWNDRSDYLQGILYALDGLEYYINDFTSTGICYYDIYDIYNIQIGETTYKCMMLNDEINVTSGLEELIHTDMPEQSETDYEKADKTDRQINKTYIIVDKQNQTIESVVENVTEQNQKISQVEQTVDELRSEISDIADITESKESETGSVTIENVNQSEPIRVVVYPIIKNISLLYPSDNLYPSDDLYMPIRTIRFTRTYIEDEQTKTEYTDYELPMDLLYYDTDYYDEFILDYNAQTCVINKKVGYNADGTTYLLTTPETIELDYPTILLYDGDYTVSVLGYNQAYIFARMMIKNLYTDQFATRAELNSTVSQTAGQIMSTVSATYETKDNAQTNYSQIRQTTTQLSLEVGGKLDEEDFTGANIILAVNNDSSSAIIDADKISLERKNY